MEERILGICNTDKISTLMDCLYEHFTVLPWPMLHFLGILEKERQCGVFLSLSFSSCLIIYC